MIIDSLSVLDFRVFSGSHSFDLVPKLKRGKQAPIVLFGGLNGGGKTTILTALKLALYGKGTLGNQATTSDYHQYLRECVHRAQNNTARPCRSAVGLTFRYAQHGVISTYHLQREWFVGRADKVKEELLIKKDGQLLTELSYEQAQSFLNELIPIGVSELFFFDGEKIASLAEETTGDALRDSINKLLGLDLIDRLDSDLGVLVRTRAAKKDTDERKKKISAVEAEYSKVEKKLEADKEKIVQLKLEISEVERKISQLDSAIKARGGAWSSSRQEESTRLDILVLRKKALELSLQELAGGLLPLAIANTFSGRLVKQLKVEQEALKVATFSTFVKKQEESFLAAMRQAVPASISNDETLLNAYRETFKAALQPFSGAVNVLHELSDPQIASIEDRLTRALVGEHAEVMRLTSELDQVYSSIDIVEENLARAPDDSLLSPLFKEQALYQERLGALKAKKIAAIENAKKHLHELSSLAKKLDELNADALKAVEKERLYLLVGQTRDVLKEFLVRARESKLRELESQFYLSFNNLARKRDRHLSIRIDSQSFEVELLDEKGEVIRKSELSAGEKQIFAISILESLARTSGRSLPVVIDTPLGRLDSVHRKKLLENYFPRTSHQVIILSTDTEVDFTFYESLRSHVSHSYHLVYSADTRSTHVEEGYFWRHGEDA
ncbi:TPA: DNA sulfur modification protein DndD [Pseudomonas aeruginosa]|nr:DNA sulfur modification protein DndD [Pseudomonas aeruginosa]